MTAAAVIVESLQHVGAEQVRWREVPWLRQQSQLKQEAVQAMSQATTELAGIDQGKAGYMGLDIGAGTVETFTEVITNSRTIQWNGPMGVFEMPNFQKGTVAIAQAIAESNLNHRAKSWASAKGIMQITPKTFHEIKKKNPSFIDINEPRWNIAAGIYYDKYLYKKWKAPRPFKDLMGFTFASYNAGFYTIVKAQKKCKESGLNENVWPSIKAVAPKVPKWRHEETFGYVDKIYHMMVF